MCGITGILNQQKPVEAEDFNEISHLLTALDHRGPDHNGYQKISPHGLFGSTRLRITDPKARRADMPMTSACKRYTVVYNGEIYNHRQLRAALPDYPFQTESDTETLLAGFAKWGVDCLSRLEGMFAFALYDSLTRQTVFAVDPSGQKFLYYLQDDLGFVFASEIQALITDRRRKKNWDKAGLSEFIAQRMIVGPDTHIREIKKLESGTYGVLKANGDFTLNRYYTVPIGDQTKTDIDAIKTDIKHATHAACDQTFDLDVSYGYFLSGGIDSALVTHYAKEAGLDLQTYSIGFTPFKGERFDLPSTFNEFEYSRYMAAQLESDHSEIVITPDQYATAIDQWVDICGEPLDSTEAPMLIHLFDAVPDHCKVIFCGSGPDESFDGYGHGAALGDIDPSMRSAAYYDRFNWTFSVDLDRLLPHHAETREAVIDKLDGFLSLYQDTALNNMQSVQLINLHGRCTSYEYRQMDVISMRHSKEVRSPLAGTGLTKAAFDFAPELKNHNGVPKGIFKDSFRGTLPERIIDRKKEGFPTPIEFWFSAAYEDRLQAAFSANQPLFSLGIIDEEYFRDIQARRHPEYRAILYRMYLLSRLIEQQTPYIGQQTAPCLNLAYQTA